MKSPKTRNTAVTPTRNTSTRTTTSKGNVGQNGSAKLEQDVVPTMRRLRDQHGGIWVRIQGPSGNALFSLEEFDSVGVYAKMAKLGVCLMTPASRNKHKSEIEGLAVSGDIDIYVADKVGYIWDPDDPTEPKSFVFPDGTLLGAKKIGDKKIHVVIEPDERCQSCGDWRTFERELSPMIREQALLITAFCFSLAPIIQPLVDGAMFVENSIVEIMGPSSKGKSTLTVAVSGSVWGGDSQRKTGYVDTWGSTVNQVELSMTNRNNCLSARDEATVSDKNSKARGENLGNAVHRFSLGEIRGRMGQKEGRAFRGLMLSTSNQSLKSILSENRQVEEGILSRIATITVPDRTSGVFDTLPQRHTSLLSCLGTLHRVSKQNYGHFAKLFIRAVLDNYANVPARTIGMKVEKLMEDFLHAAGVDFNSDVQLRKAKPFALAYASGVIAKKLGCLDQELWGSFKDPILRAMRMSDVFEATDSQVTRKDPVAWYRDFAEHRRNELYDLRTKCLITMSEKVMNAQIGFLGETGDGQKFIAFRAQSLRRVRPGFKAELTRLRDKGFLQSDASKLQTKLRVRKCPKTGEAKSDWFYVIKLDHAS